MSDRQTYTELLHTDLDATGKALAERLHQALAQEITGSFQEAAEAFPDVTDLQANELILPGLAYQTLRHLSVILAHSAEGWEQVFWGNLAERYEETGES